MEHKNPLIAGLLNMVVPGLGYLYVNNDTRRFVKTLIGGIAAIVALVFIGNAMQNSTNVSISQGICPGILSLIVFVPLFLSGQKVASQHNRKKDNAARYDETQHGTSEARLTRNQAMRDNRMISEEEYESRKEGLTSKK